MIISILLLCQSVVTLLNSRIEKEISNPLRTTVVTETTARVRGRRPNLKLGFPPPADSFPPGPASLTFKVVVELVAALDNTVVASLIQDQRIWALVAGVGQIMHCS